MIRLFSGLATLFIACFMSQSVQAKTLNDLVNGRWDYCVVQGWEYNDEAIDGWSLDYKSDCVREYEYLAQFDVNELLGDGTAAKNLKKIAAEKHLWMPNSGCSHATAQTTNTVTAFNLVVETTNYDQDGNVSKTCTTGLSTR